MTTPINLDVNFMNTVRVLISGLTGLLLSATGHTLDESAYVAATTGIVEESARNDLVVIHREGVYGLI